MKPQNITTLLNEIAWLQQVIDQVIISYLMQEGHEKHWLDLPVPDLSKDESVYANYVRQGNLNVLERLALALAMAPHLKPEALDVFFAKNGIYDRPFTEFGGLVDQNHSGFIPTGQTLAFLITSGNPEFRVDLLAVFSKDSFLVKEQILLLAATEDHIPYLNGALSLSNQWMQYFLTEEELKTAPNANFPAKQIRTEMTWEDVVINKTVREQLEEITTWLKHGPVLMEDLGLKKMFQPGYKALFYGPPGTGKTLTAMLIGKVSNQEVYSVELSLIFSKDTKETEQNLVRFFERATQKNWMLFFDEADVLFGKRSSKFMKKHQVAYLWQYIEDFPGTIILALNATANIDEAMSRRFQNIIYFAMPNAEERYQLWTNIFSSEFPTAPEVDLKKIAAEYELTGGSIVNVVRFCALAAIGREDKMITQQDLIQGIRRELEKGQ